MKKIFILLMLVASTLHAQHTIKGFMSPPDKNNWMVLSKLEGTKPKFIQNITVKKEIIKIKGKNSPIGKFEFKLPANAKPGMYRLSYRQDGNSFVDVIYNKEDIELTFNSELPEESVFFEKSKENKIYREFFEASILTQYAIDEAQEKYIDDPSISNKKTYKEALDKLEDVVKIYSKKSKGMLANHFIKASYNINPKEPVDTMQDYLSSKLNNYYSNIDFSSKELYNSFLLVEKVVDYVFYLNIADSKSLQQKLYKESVDRSLAKISDPKFKKEMTEFLISQFTARQDSEIVDYIFDRHYSRLPFNLQDKKFKAKQLKLLKASIGRIAPDFSWKEHGKNYKLSTLNDANEYLLIFWSTQCPHCTEEIPQVHNFIKNKRNISVVAFAIEDQKDKAEFNRFAKKLNGWHNVFGTHPEYRFKNKTIQEYLIEATPTYLVLDRNKKIIAKPDTVKEVIEYFSN